MPLKPMSVQPTQKQTTLRVAASQGDIEKPYLDACERVLAEGVRESDWLKAHRREGIERFKAYGFPHRRVEAWKFTDLRPKMKEQFNLVRGQETPQHVVVTPFDETPSYRLFINDGVFESALSSVPKQNGVEIVTLRQSGQDLPAWVKDQLVSTASLSSGPMLELGTALMRDGLFIYIAEGTVLDRPLHVIFQTTSETAQYHTRLSIVLEKGVEATLLESHVSANGQASFHNQATQIQLGEGAILRHISVEATHKENLHVTSLNARLAQSASYTAMSAVSGGALVRTEAKIMLEGAGARTNLSGVYMLVETQHCDHTIVIDHAAPNCTSRQVYQGVLTESARGVFQGKVVVAKGAGGTDAHQLSRALLLSDKAEADAKPELEIYADDVKCSHGATIGELDREALFYLRARGIPLGQAKSLLIEAFLDDVVEGAADEVLSAPIKNHISNWLKEHEAQIIQEGHRP